MRRIFVALFLTLISTSAFAQSLKPEVKPFILDGEITEQTVVDFRRWYTSAMSDPELIITSVGGDLNASLEIAQIIFQNQHFKCFVPKLAASGAFGIFQMCHIRVVAQSALLGTHEPSLELKFARKMFGRTIDRYEAQMLYEDLNQFAKIWNVICSARLNLTLKEYTKKVRGKSWVMGANEAIRVGAADFILISTD